jgi:hypothetical protein
MCVYALDPNKYSQLLYVISPKGRNDSILDSTALHSDYNEKTSDEADAMLFAYRLRTKDVKAWKLLAEAMAKELEKQS